MEVKERAKQLVDKYLKDYGEKNKDGSFTICIVSIGRAKQCALILVDEIINEYNETGIQGTYFDYRIAHWQDVKLELEKM